MHVNSINTVGWKSIKEDKRAALWQATGGCITVHRFVTSAYHWRLCKFSNAGQHGLEDRNVSVYVSRIKEHSKGVLILPYFVTHCQCQGLGKVSSSTRPPLPPLPFPFLRPSFFLPFLSSTPSLPFLPLPPLPFLFLFPSGWWGGANTLPQTVRGPGGAL